MPSRKRRDRALDQAWARLVDELPALRNSVRDYDQIREIVGGAIRLAVRQLEESIARKETPPDWQDPRIERGSSGYTIRMGLKLQEWGSPEDPVAEIDTEAIPQMAEPIDLEELSRLPVDPNKMILLSSERANQLRMSAQVRQVAFRMPAQALLHWSEQIPSWLTETLRQCARILIHGPLLEKALLKNNAKAASHHTAALVDSGWRLRIIPYDTLIAGAEKARAAASRNYGGEEERGERDTHLANEILAQCRSDPSRSLKSILYTVVSQTGANYSKLRRIAKEKGITAASIKRIAGVSDPTS